MTQHLGQGGGHRNFGKPVASALLAGFDGEAGPLGGKLGDLFRVARTKKDNTLRAQYGYFGYQIVQNLVAMEPGLRQGQAGLLSGCKRLPRHRDFHLIARQSPDITGPGMALTIKKLHNVARADAKHAQGVVGFLGRKNRRSGDGRGVGMIETVQVRHAA